MIHKGCKSPGIAKKTGLILMLVGVMLMLYPLFTYMYAWHEQSKMQAALRAVEEGSEASPVPDGPRPGDLGESGEFKGALIEIPSIKLSAAVASGTSKGDLMTAPGWYKESALPGQGNTAIAAHRTMYGAWFRHLDSLMTGDRIILTYEGRKYIYTVKKVFPVAKNDWSVIKSCGYPALTLTTCHPVGSAKQRLIVRAQLAAVN